MGMLTREFSSIDKTQELAAIKSKKYPDMVFQPHIELDESSVIDEPQIDKSEIDPYERDTIAIEESEIAISVLE